MLSTLTTSATHLADPYSEYRAHGARNVRMGEGNTIFWRRFGHGQVEFSINDGQKSVADGAWSKAA